MAAPTTTNDEPSLTENVRSDTAQIQATMRYVGQRQRWLWSYAIVVTILLTVAIASFGFPGLLTQTEAYFPFNFNLAVSALVGLVLVFNVYSVYQQLQIHRVQAELSRQIATMDRMEARNEEIYKIALLDPLTGLYNRRSGEQRLSEEVSRAQRSGLPLTVLMLDLDRLKEVNDTLGHAAGDEAIKCFARRISAATRGSDLAVRLGGDEFLLLLSECKPDEVRHVLGRLSDVKMYLGGKELPLHFSAGWTNYIPGESADELMKRADEALYANKRTRRDQTAALTGRIV